MPHPCSQGLRYQSYLQPPDKPLPCCQSGFQYLPSKDIFRCLHMNLNLRSQAAHPHQCARSWISVTHSQSQSPSICPCFQHRDNTDECQGAVGRETMLSILATLS